MNNVTARNNILQRLRQPQRPACNFAERDHYSRFDWDKAERIRRFTERMTAVRAEIHHADRASWLDTLVAICAEKGLNNLLLSPNTAWGQAISAQAERFPALRHYDQPIDGWKQDMFYGIDAAFTSTLGGIAETGTLILWPDAEEPRQMSLVPPVHIAVLDTEQLYTTFAEAVREQGWVDTGLPTNALLVSGPSKSADIEQTLAYGVHGPKALVVILV